MSFKDSKWLTLKEIEGVVSPHDEYVRRELEMRKEALKYVQNVAKLADYIGGTVEKLGVGEDWAIKKAFFPGVEAFFIYWHGDEEFPGNFRVLFSGDRIRAIQGDDLASITIACANHMLRYIRETTPDQILPEICYRV